MNRFLDDDEDLLQQRDRELTLSTGAILAIFLGLVLLCAIFFGFGYNLGRKSTVSIPGPSAAAPAPESTSPSDSSDSSGSSTFNNFKPSPSSPAVSHNSANTATVAVPTSTPAPIPTAPTITTAASAATATPRATTVAPRPPAPAPAPVHTAAPVVPTAPISVPNGAFVVQVAAVSRKDDADLLVNALHAKGYQVAARSTPQDKLLHIQVGPFATRKDAEAMREKLIIDGYNAIVK